MTSGCRWFAGNPLFPTGKIEVSYKVINEKGEEASTGILGVVSVTDVTSESNSSTSTEANTTITESESLQEGNKYEVFIDNDGVPHLIEIPPTIEQTSDFEATITTELASSESYVATISVSFARIVEFTFTPINKVGAEIKSCEVIYTDNQGLPINKLNKKLEVYLYIPPFDGSGEITEETSRTLKLEIFDQNTQDYYIIHNIPFGQAIITFNGFDGAGHEITLKKAISINANMIDDSLQAEIDQQIQEIMQSQNESQSLTSSCSSCS